MQITFLVGNGFDISCGIDTSYRSFYNWYIKQDSSSEVIKKFKEDIKSDLIGKGKRWADFESGLGQFSKNFTKETVDDFIEIYEDAHESIITYIESERNKYKDSIDVPESLASLKDGILNFSQELTPAEQDVIAKIKAADQGNETIVKFISFNYTNTLDICVKELSKSPLKIWKNNGAERRYYVSPSVLHIHGTLNHYPILGVGEEYQFANKDLLSCPGVSEIMVKSKSVKTMGEHWYSDAAKEIKNSRIICVWGMSLGDTDSTWWGEIAEWLKLDETRQLIIFWRTKTPPNGKSVYRYVSEKAKVVERLMQFTDFTNETINNVRNRIHVVYNTEKVLRVSFSTKEEIKV